MYPVTILRAENAPEEGSPIVLEPPITEPLSAIHGEAKDSGGHILRLFFGRQVLAIERDKHGETFRFMFRRGDVDPAGYPRTAISSAGLGEQLARVMAGQRLVSLKMFKAGFAVELDTHTLLISPVHIACIGPDTGVAR